MIRNVRDYLDARRGVHMVAQASADGVTLGVAAAQALRQNPTRVAFLFVNLSPNVMYLTPIGTPSAAKGCYVGPNGGSLGLLAEEDGEVVAWEWRGIAGAAASQYFVLETLLREPVGAT